VIPAANSTVRQEISLQQGIPTEKAKDIVKFLKDAKLKRVQASIQGDSAARHVTLERRPAGSDAAVARPGFRRRAPVSATIVVRFQRFRKSRVPEV
jgi:hypothetical protein